jgi:hypothetical protein
LTKTGAVWTQIDPILTQIAAVFVKIRLLKAYCCWQAEAKNVGPDAWAGETRVLFLSVHYSAQHHILYLLFNLAVLTYSHEKNYFSPAYFRNRYRFIILFKKRLLGAVQK